MTFYSVSYLCAIIILTIATLCNGVFGQKQCEKPGYMCQSCNSSVVCLEINGNLTMLPPAYCSGGQTCQKSTGQCTSDFNPECDDEDIPFICTNAGMFPHPTLWTKYVICTPSSNKTKMTAIMMDCEEGMAYDAASTYCNIPIKCVDPAIPPVPACTANEVFPLERNPTIFIECHPYSQDNVKIYPFQNSCPRGAIYQDFHCVDRKCDC